MDMEGTSVHAHCSRRSQRGLIRVALVMLGMALWWLVFPAEVHAARHTCANYPNQAAAQRAYRADPIGLRGLDADRDGIACEMLPGPFDLVPVRLVAVAPVRPVLPRAGAGDLNSWLAGGLTLLTVGLGLRGLAASFRAGRRTGNFR
jgi:hypothetical protein